MEPMSEAQYYEALKILCNGNFWHMHERVHALLDAAKQGPVQGMNVEAVTSLAENLMDRIKNDPTIDERA